jgi:hypothetical protein
MVKFVGAALFLGSPLCLANNDYFYLIRLLELDSAELARTAHDGAI